MSDTTPSQPVDTGIPLPVDSATSTSTATPPVVAEPEIVTTNVAVNKGFMPGKIYDVLKWIALIFLPAAGTLYFGLAGIWDWPNEDKILASVTAFDTFLGIMLGISTMNYNRQAPAWDGDMILDTSHPEKDVLRMALNGDPHDLVNKDKVTFKVVK